MTNPSSSSAQQTPPQNLIPSISASNGKQKDLITVIHEAVAVQKLTGNGLLERLQEDLPCETLIDREILSSGTLMCMLRGVLYDNGVEIDKRRGVKINSAVIRALSGQESEELNKAFGIYSLQTGEAAFQAQQKQHSAAAVQHQSQEA
jgi:hypothetical protein